MPDVNITISEGQTTLSTELIYDIDRSITFIEPFIPYAHPDINAADSTSNTGPTVIQNITLDVNGHVIGVSSVAGGGGGIDNVVEDTSPQLGGSLDVNSQFISSTNSSGIRLRASGTGPIIINNSGSGDIGLSTTSGGVSIQGLTYPATDGSNGQLIATNGSGVLLFQSVTSATGNELNDVVDDLTPDLGGDLDVNGNSIISTANGDISITPNGTGSIILDGLNWPQADGSASQVIETDGAGTLGWATIWKDLLEDLTPQLGGSLDVNGQSIVSVSNGDIPITPNGTGKVILDGLNWPTADGSADQVLKTDGAGNLSFATPAGGGGKFIYKRSARFLSGSATRYYMGDNNYGGEGGNWTSFLSSLTSCDADHIFEGGLLVPFALSNLSFKATVWTNGTSGPDFGAYLLKGTRSADNTANTSSIALTTVASNVAHPLTNANYMYNLDATSVNGATDADFLIMAFSGSETTKNYYVNFTIYGDLA